MEGLPSTLTVLSSNQCLETIGSFEIADLLTGPMTGFFVSAFLTTFYFKQLDEAIARSEQFFSSFMDHLPGFAWMKNAAGQYLYINKLLEQLPPYQNGWLGKTDLDLWPPAMATTYRGNDQIVVTTGKTLEAVESYVVGGEEHHVLVIKFPIFDNLGAVVMVGGTSVDITERKRAEQALRASEERYRELFENARDAVYVHDLKGVYVSVNRAAEKLSGYSREEIIGKHFSAFVAPRQVEQVRAKLARKLVAHGGTSYEVEVLARDGRPVPVEVSSNLIYENGVAVGVQGLARDITERRRAEKAIREAEQKYREIFEHAVEGIFQTGAGGGYISANPALARMFGFDSPEELIREKADLSKQRYIDPQRHEEFLRLLEEQDVVRDFEYEDYRKDGSTIWVSDNVRAKRDEKGRLLYYEGTTQDITERKRAEEALRSYSRRLIEAQEAERQNIARELHDQIGQVLTAVRIGLDNLKRQAPTGVPSPQLDDNIAIVDQALRRVRDLSLELHPALLDDLGLTAALRWYLDSYTQRTGIRTDLTLENLSEEKRLPRKLEIACFRVVQEALTNVARHAEAQQASVELKHLKECLHVYINDNGKGFDPAVLRKRDAAHVTLGLRGMDERAQALGGTVEIISAPSAGTEIHLVLPLRLEN